MVVVVPALPCDEVGGCALAVVRTSVADRVVLCTFSVVVAVIVGWLSEVVLVCWLTVLCVVKRSS